MHEYGLRVGAPDTVRQRAGGRQGAEAAREIAGGIR
jgi:hypothetical protein